MLHSICQQIWKAQQWKAEVLESSQDWKRSVFIPIPKKGNAKECSNYCTIALISHVSKVMLKILQARLQQYVNRELLDVQAAFRKARGTRDQIANICRHKSKTVPEKHLLLLYRLCQSLWLCGSQQTEKFFKRWEYQATLSVSWETCVQVKKQTCDQTWNNRLVPNRERVCQGCILSPCLFNLYAEYIMRNAGLEEAQAGIKIAGRNIK